MTGSDDPGRLGRDAYTYGHIPLIAGIIVSAVGDKIVIEAPTAILSPAEIAVVFGGPILYLAGHLWFRWVMIRDLGRRRLTAIVALAATAVATALLDPRADVAAGAATLVLVTLAAWEFRSARSRVRIPVLTR